MSPLQIKCLYCGLGALTAKNMVQMLVVEAEKGDTLGNRLGFCCLPIVDALRESYVQLEEHSISQIFSNDVAPRSSSDAIKSLRLAEAANSHCSSKTDWRFSSVVRGLARTTLNTTMGSPS